MIPVFPKGVTGLMMGEGCKLQVRLFSNPGSGSHRLWLLLEQCICLSPRVLTQRMRTIVPALQTAAVAGDLCVKPPIYLTCDKQPSAPGLVIRDNQVLPGAPTGRHRGEAMPNYAAKAMCSEPCGGG